MVKISAFKSLRPLQNIVEKVTTQPYSNYTQDEIKKELQKNKFSFLNIIANNQSNDLKERYKYINEKIRHFKENKILEKDKKDSIYIYKQTNNHNTYIGIICAVDIQEYQQGKIKIHEQTIKKRELLFAKYLKNIKIHAEPVLLTYDDKKPHIKQKYLTAEKKIYEFQSQDHTHHEIWRITKKHEIQEIIDSFKKIDKLYIADGHHRMASSAKDNINSKCLAYIISKNQLNTFPFHRVVKSNKKLCDNIKKQLNISRIKFPVERNEKINFYMENVWYQLTEEKTEKDVLKNLLVSRLSKEILNPIFNITDERKSKKVYFLPGNTDIDSLIKKINKQDILFIMNQINIDTIIEIANQEKTTPPKSTFIVPKLPSGLIMMEL